jgi:hypothetical protein
MQTDNREKYYEAGVRVLARLGHDCPRDVIEVVARKIQLLCPLSLTAQFAN